MTVILERRAGRCERYAVIQEAEAAESRMNRAVAEWDLEFVRAFAPVLEMRRSLRRIVDRKELWT